VPILFTVIAAFTSYDAHERRKLTPSADLTLATFFDWQPGEHYSTVVNAGSKQRLIVYGDTKGLLPSGPSAYVFDRAGDLIDWTSDEGDDRRFKERWRTRSGPTTPIDRTSARQWMESNAAPPGERGPVRQAPLWHWLRQCEPKTDSKPHHTLNN
jgi:hypothetical protein